MRAEWRIIPWARRLPKTVLDICCGTGQLASHFLLKGYRVQGIDLSQYMIAIAVENNRSHVSSGKASFTIQDASQFGISTPVSYAVCLYDAMNHLVSKQAVRSCFQRVYDALSPEGLFVFDINTKRGLHRWNGLSVEEDDDVFICNCGVFADDMDRAYTNIVGFVRGEDGRYERYRETVFNVVHSVDDLLSSLKEIGFTKTYCACSDDLSSAVEDPESMKRVYFISEKP